MNVIIKRARKIAKNFSFVYGKEITANTLTTELSYFFQEFTYSRGTRPFGACIFIIGFGNEGPELFQINPDGNIYYLKANMIGKGADKGLTFLNKRWNKNLTHEEAILISFLSLKEASECSFKSSDINIAFIDEQGTFKILKRDDINIILPIIEEKKKQKKLIISILL